MKQFPLPPIEDEALAKFCKQHNLYQAVAAGYHYAHKCFPTAKNISLRFRPPYYADEPEEADIIFDIETSMTRNEVRDARHRFIKATNNISGIEYISTSYRFVKHESS